MPNAYINSLPIRDDTLNNPNAIPGWGPRDPQGSATDGVPKGAPLDLTGLYNDTYQGQNPFCWSEAGATCATARRWAPWLTRMIEPRPDFGCWLVALPADNSVPDQPFYPAHRQKVYGIPRSLACISNHALSPWHFLWTARIQALRVLPYNCDIIPNLLPVICGLPPWALPSSATIYEVKQYLARGWAMRVTVPTSSGPHAIALVGLLSPDPFGPVTDADIAQVHDQSRGWYPAPTYTLSYLKTIINFNYLNYAVPDPACVGYLRGTPYYDAAFNPTTNINAIVPENTDSVSGPDVAEFAKNKHAWDKLGMSKWGTTFYSYQGGFSAFGFPQTSDQGFIEDRANVRPVSAFMA